MFRLQMGDILVIVNDDDPTWWQAHHISDVAATAPGSAGTPSSARIIPSKHYQER